MALHFGASSPVGSDPAALLYCLLLQQVEEEQVLVGHWRKQGEEAGNLKTWRFGEVEVEGAVGEAEGLLLLLLCWE